MPIPTLAARTFRLKALFAALLCLLASPLRSEAALLNTLDEQAVTWRATHIVVVDTSGKVSESWLGDAKAGERIDLEKLKVQMCPREDVLTFDASFHQTATYIQATSLILFLIDSHPSTGRQWAGTLMEEFHLDVSYSMAWVVGNEVYGRKTTYSDGYDPGVKKFTTLAQFRETISQFLPLKRSFLSALAEPNPSRRAWKLLPFTTNAHSIVRYSAYNALSRMHGAAGRVFRHLLLKPKPDRFTDEALRAVANTGPHDAVPILSSFANRELRFWRGQIPTLKRGWSKGESLEERRQLLVDAMSWLARLGAPRATPIAQTVLKFSRANALFREGLPTDEIQATCRSILHGTATYSEWEPEWFNYMPPGSG